MQTTRIELNFEQRETWRVTHNNCVSTANCPFCVEDSPMLKAEDLASAFGKSPREIYHQIESGGLHFIETGEMKVMVCLSSYAQRTSASEAIPAKSLAIGSVQ